MSVCDEKGLLLETLSPALSRNTGRGRMRSLADHRDPEDESLAREVLQFGEEIMQRRRRVVGGVISLMEQRVVLAHPDRRQRQQRLAVRTGVEIFVIAAAEIVVRIG